MTPPDPMNAAQAIEKLRERLGEIPVTEFRGESTVVVPRERLVEACRLLKDECGANMLVDLSGVDHFGAEPRFEVSYQVRSLAHRYELRLKVRLPEHDASVDTVTGVWQTADWHEREAFDMYGIRFAGHPNLTRILMWEGYPHFPLRKDFPLAGLPCDLPSTAVDAGRADIAPMADGPFVTRTGTRRTLEREPRQYDTAAEQIEKSAGPEKEEPV
jgi:NADH-quinone oxidoreductase subunit C